MILILTETGDVSADKVCLWLRGYGLPFVRMNTNKAYAFVSKVQLVSGQWHIEVAYEGRNWMLNDFSFIWFRRGYFNFKGYHIANQAYPGDGLLDRLIQNHLDEEIKTLRDFVYGYIATNIPCLNNPMVYNINKLMVLEAARKEGLSIPPTCILTRKSDMQQSLGNPGWITKNIQDVLSHRNGKFKVHQNVETQRAFEEYELPEHFFYSLFQSGIEKRADVRVFFVGDAFFAVSSFADGGEAPIRVAPFTLPDAIAQKLQRLMTTLQLNSGSIDLLVDQNDDYHFLEVNPVGQFDFVSEYGGYPIEQTIANYIKTHRHERVAFC